MKIKSFTYRAVKLFLRQSLRTGGFPFDVTIKTPNTVTVAAMKEAECIVRDPNVRYYSDVEEALSELKR